jgi:hypothetical protein
VDGGSDLDVESYLKFSVSGLSGTVHSAKLRLYVQSGTADGPSVYTTSTGWTETGITWNNRPALGAQLDDKPALAVNTFTDYNVTAAVTGNGTYNFGLGPTPTTDGADFASREAGSNPPQLLVTTG